VVFWESALRPKALLLLPVVLAASALSPKAELLPAVVLEVNAEAPTAVLPVPVRLALVFPADVPRKVLLVPKLCRNEAPPKVTTPDVPPDVVFGSARLPVRLMFPEILWLPVKELAPAVANAVEASPFSIAAFTLLSPAPLPEKDEAVMLPVNVLELAVSCGSTDGSIARVPEPVIGPPVRPSPLPTLLT